MKKIKSPKRKLLKEAKGITLITLVIIILIIIILSGVTINMVLGNDGLLKQAVISKDMVANSIAAEEEKMDEAEKKYANEMAEDSNPQPPQEIISTTDSYVGYYADIEGDGTVDGVIYADLAKGNTGDGQWTNSDGNYTIPVKTNLKDYYISKQSYTDDFGTKDVITPVEGQSEKNDRFYIMAIEDIDGSEHYWYFSAYGQMSIDTDTAFGTGKANTQTMISQWNSNEYRPQDDNDMWKLIQTQASKGWFVPSKEEWSAFGEELGITSSNYTEKGLSDRYWSSSQGNASDAWSAHFIIGYLGNDSVSNNYYVRLSATF